MRYLLLSLIVLSLSSCATMLPAQSLAEIKLDEVAPDGTRFILSFKTKGDGENAQGLKYRGEGENPWELTVGQNAVLTSPATMAGVEAWSALARDASVIIGALVPLLRPMPLEPLDAAASTTPTVLEVILDAFTGRP